MAITGHARHKESLAERFWSLARAAEGEQWSGDERDPVAVVRRVLQILDALDTNQPGAALTHRTVSFLTLLHQQEAAGDLSYASPEQARGDRIDERSLVFSVGVLIFEQLTGRHPFGSTDGPRRVARMQRGELGSGVQYFPQVPPALRAVLVRSMGPFPEERYASMTELRAELERFAGVSPGKAPIARRASPHDATGQIDVSDEPAQRPTARVAATVREPVVRGKTAATPARNVWVDRLVSAALGAIVASAVTVGLRPRDAAVPVVVAPPAPPAQRAPIAVPLPREPVVVPVPASAAPETFDPQHAGERAASALHACFETRVATFGVGILFPKGSAQVRRAYLAKDEPLSPAERRCVVGRLVGLDVGVAPTSLTVVELRLRLRRDGGHSVRATIAPP